jgi:protoporphyrin/coproporphyrin ferrochelatase
MMPLRDLSTNHSPGKRPVSEHALRPVERGHRLTQEPIAVVAFQLGGPDSLAAVEPFLYNLFSDPDIIDFPFARLARPTLARLISSRRARHVQEHYASIGGKSPICELTQLQANALERELRESRGLDARVIVAMRYWHPLTEQVVEQVTRGGFRRLVLLPLYPQYSKTTTGSSLNEWRRLWARAGKSTIPTAVIDDYHDHPAYLDAVVEKINEGLARFRPEATSSSPPPGNSSASGAGDSAAKTADDVLLIFSAHGIPVRFIEAGDPYQRQIEATTRLVMQRGGWPNAHTLCYQSRVNPGKWLEPSLTVTLRGLAAAGAKRVLVVPISFVTDHVETLAEIDHEAREIALHSGIEHFELMPALNDSPAFIRALAEMVIAYLYTM